MRHQRRDHGFTLIEIMVVMVVIGILATFLSLSIGNRAIDDRLEVEARRMQQLVQFAAEQAQIQGTEIGIRTTTEGFEFLAMDNNGLWQSVDEGMLRPRAIVEPFYVELQVEGQKVSPVAVDRLKEREQREEDRKQDADQADDDDARLELDSKPKNRPQPQVFLLSSGDATAFTLDLKLKGFPSYYRLDCDVLTRCKLDRQLERS